MKQVDIDETLAKVWQVLKLYIDDSQQVEAATEMVSVLDKAGWDLEHLDGFDDELDEALYRLTEEPEEELEGLDDIYE